MEYRVLGPLEVLAAGGEKLALGGAMQQSVLASLLLRAGQTVALERLIEGLWDEPPETATRTVQVYISRLRHTLPERAIESRPGGYRLALDGAAFDLEEFEQRAEEGRRALAAGHHEDAGRLLRSALALWRGPPLAGLTSEPLRRQAERLEELRLTALEDRLEADLYCARDAEIVPELKTLVAEHPFRERLRAQLMRALYRSGRPGEALALYRETRRLLVEELGMEPGQELRELEQAILRQDAELEAPGRRRSTAPAVPAPIEPEVRNTVTDRSVGELPQGTVSLLFTDVEGSTQLQHRLGERYHEVVAEHRRLLEQAFAEHGGIVVDRQTESFFVVFTRARYSLQAAAAAQVALAEHDWPDGVHVKVRMGIHSGDPEVAGDRYVGLAVARAARICAAAHGGQVLLSSSARALLSDHDRSALRSLGLHRLKDFEEPEPISQLIVDGLPSQFPPLRTEAASPRRKRLLLAAGVVVAAGAIASLVLAFSSGSSSIKVGPTSLAVIDPKSNRVVDAIDVGFKSNLIAAGEGAIWLVDPQGSTLVKIDPATRKINRIGVAAGAGSIPFGLAVGNGAVWVAVFHDSREVVREFGPDVGDLRRTIPYGGQAQTPVLYRISPLAVGDGAVWAIDPARGGIWRIPERGRAREVQNGLDALSLAARGEAVWVAGASVLTKLDAFTGLPLGSPPVGSPLSADTASVAVGQSAVWYTASSQTTLWKLDPQLASPADTFPVGKGPAGIAIGKRAVWVANSGDGTVTRLDSSGGAPRTIRVGQAPGGAVAAYGNVWISPGQPRS